MPRHNDGTCCLGGQHGLTYKAATVAPYPREARHKGGGLFLWRDRHCLDVTVPRRTNTLIATFSMYVVSRPSSHRELVLAARLLDEKYL